MTQRRSARATRHDDQDELATDADDEFAGQADDELAGDGDEELAGDGDEELAEEPGQASNQDSDSGQRPRHDRGDGLTAAAAARAALRQIAELTGKQAEGITGVEPAEGGWLVGVEVIEDERIPASTDILAIYQTGIGTDGELLSYRRVRRYTRGL